MKAKTFKEFIGEAYVDQDGVLHDFSITKDDEVSLQLDETIKDIEANISNSGGYSISSEYLDGILYIYFKYDLDKYLIVIWLDNNIASLQKHSNNKAETLYSDSIKDFIDSLMIDGINRIIEENE